MKKLQKINLAKLSKEELDKRELSKLLGGATCCICGNPNNPLNTNMNNAGDLSTSGGGYGTGSFRG